METGYGLRHRRSGVKGSNSKLSLPLVFIQKSFMQHTAGGSQKSLLRNTVALILISVFYCQVTHPESKYAAQFGLEGPSAGSTSKHLERVSINDVPHHYMDGMTGAILTGNPWNLIALSKIVTIFRTHIRLNCCLHKSNIEQSDELLLLNLLTSGY